MANTAAGIIPLIFTTASVESAYKYGEVDHSYVYNSSPIQRPPSVMMKINDIEANIIIDYTEYGTISDSYTFEIRPSSSNLQAIILALINDTIKITIGDTTYTGKILNYNLRYTEPQGHLICLKMVVEHKKKIEHRYCFKCNSLITYSEFYLPNRFKHTSEFIKKLWEDPRVELLCCGCYKKPEPEFKLREGIPRCSICNEPIGGMGFFGLCYNCNSKKVDTSCDRQLGLGGIVIQGRRPTLYDGYKEPEWMTVIKNIKKECEKLIEGEKNYD